jgi:hypothetical protein
MQRTTRRLGPFERCVVAALLFLLVAAALPSVVQRRRAPRETELRAVRSSFAEAVGALHARWLTSGGHAREIELDGVRLALNEHGWPTLDPRHPAQDTAREIYAAILRAPLPEGWTAHETPAEQAGSATFELSGSDSFRYDSATGEVE